MSDILAALDNSLVFDIYMEQLDALILAMHDYRTDDLVIDYSGIDIFIKSNMSILNSLKGIYDRGILYLVAGEDKLSDKCVPLKYICGDGQKASFGEADEILRNVSFNEYVLNKFSSYTDKVTCNHLDYEIEYIISGKSSDRENLSNVCSEIIGLRTIPNLVYLFTDSVKCEEAESLAFLIAGSSGIPALVTAMKYVILSIWAYAESITDMKNLLSDKKVPILKSDDTFNMSLEKLLAMDFTLDKQSSYGMKYEDFLRLLLFLENYGRKNNTTMNLVDFHMINAGAGNFCIRNMVCGADIITKYTYNGGKKYIRSSTYSY